MRNIGKKCVKISKNYLKSGLVYTFCANITKNMFYFAKLISDFNIVARR